MKTKHINVVIGHIKVAIPYTPECNLLTLTTQIREQARKMTGFLSCETSLGKVPAPPEPVEAVTMPMVETDGQTQAKLATSALDIPDFMKRKA